jgi:hypothetical protein
MLDLQGKINANSMHPVLSVTLLAAAMLSALPEEWSVPKAILKERKNLLPSMVIAKVQVEWPGKALTKQLGGSIYFGQGGILTLLPSIHSLTTLPNSFSNANFTSSCPT